MLKTPILAILRGVKEIELKPLIETFINSGIDTIEITMNTNNVEELIKKAIEYSDGKLVVGAGTVLSMEQLNIALRAGAQFIVTPVVNEDIVKACVENDIPVFPGALTPTEIWKAWILGATMVKVFPAGAFGSKYFKDVLGPLDSVKLMAVGGVNEKNIKDYFNAGASAVAIGGSLMSRERLENKQFNLIEKDIIQLLQNIS